MSNLLIDERPLQFLPTLAKVLKSSDKALMLQQIKYWMNNPKIGKVVDGRKWIRNTVDEWHKQFPWLAAKTVQRYLKDLEDKKILSTSNLNRLKFDRTKWYSIDYNELDKLLSTNGQNDQMEEDKKDNSKGTGSPVQNGTTSPSLKGTDSPKQYHRLPKTTSKTTHSASKNDALSESALKSSFELLWKDYPNKKGKREAFNHYKVWRKKSVKNTDQYLVNQLKKYLVYCQQNSSWYHPMNGSTWFNGRFDDVLVTDNIPPQQPQRRRFGRQPIQEKVPDWFDHEDELAATQEENIDDSGDPMPDD